MLNLSISHIAGTVGACPLDGVMHLRFRVQKGLVASAKLVYNCDKNQWHQFRLEAPMEVTFTDSESEYYSVAVQPAGNPFRALCRGLRVYRDPHRDFVLLPGQEHCKRPDRRLS